MKKIKKYWNSLSKKEQERTACRIVCLVLSSMVLLAFIWSFARAIAYVGEVVPEGLWPLTLIGFMFLAFKIFPILCVHLRWK